MASTPIFVPWILYVFGLAVLPVLIFIRDVGTWYRLPPGPLPIPFYGNIIPTKKPWLKFLEWSKVYGPIFTIWQGRRPTLVISNPIIAADLMEKRSNKYSSRPRFVVMGEIFRSGEGVLIQPYGKSWSLRRRMLHRALTPAALKTYQARQEAEASKLVFGLMLDSQHWDKAFELFTASVVISIAYGHRVDSRGASITQERIKSMQFMAKLNVPGAYLAESFPIMKYIPSCIAPWKKEIEEQADVERNANIALVERVRRDIQLGKEQGNKVPPSLTQTLLSVRDAENIVMPETDFASIPAAVFGAGSDTTASAMCTAILGLVTSQPVLKAAQAELDAVIGLERSPTFEDEVRLPYIRALVKEVLRWRPVAVLGGTPHASTEDDVYEPPIDLSRASMHPSPQKCTRYHIPAGTTVLGNLWAINLNETYYPEPHQFNPARFLDENDPRFLPELKGETHPSKTGHASYGWGRRICPGADLANSSLFITISKLCWAFNISPTTEYDTFAYTEGFNIRPKEFECKIDVRTEVHRSVLEKEMKVAAQKLLDFPVFD